MVPYSLNHTIANVIPCRGHVTIDFIIKIRLWQISVTFTMKHKDQLAIYLFIFYLFFVCLDNSTSGCYKLLQCVGYS